MAAALSGCQAARQHLLSDDRGVLAATQSENDFKILKIDRFETPYATVIGNLSRCKLVIYNCPKVVHGPYFQEHSGKHIDSPEQNRLTQHRC